MESAYNAYDYDYDAGLDQALHKPSYTHTTDIYT